MAALILSACKEKVTVKEAAIDNVTTVTDNSAQYLAYSDSLYDSLLGKEPFALFFHASWCETCVGLEKQINNDLTNFPDGTKILKTNFDTETDLRKTYGITLQSNIVVIDKNGDPTVTLLAPNNNVLKQAIEATL